MNLNKEAFFVVPNLGSSEKNGSDEAIGGGESVVRPRRRS